ncbi:hypothetical protein GYMLUDRAFT_248075 [Collybiopsis luxurians FD-317 M1]|uniref:Uncharacterized protein n=1 Tax=Collybiopsis luxurians FD-317 M1 TaxID=944289 RepID=A0A0D0CLQ7_9AGAR|nr:hypothetical protein GYMLUDRAFT_248075 [Collybiopsis luxurians FD-317 M1]
MYLLLIAPRSANSSDANNLRDLATRIANDLIPPITDCVGFYEAFANRQVAALSVTSTKSSLEDLAAQNAKDAVMGLSKVQAAQTKVLNFKNQAVFVDNVLNQRGNKLQLARVMPKPTQYPRNSDIKLQTVNDSVKGLVDLTVSWSSLTQEANNLAALLKIINDVPATAGALASQAKAAWDSLVANINKW